MNMMKLKTFPKQHLSLYEIVFQFDPIQSSNVMKNLVCTRKFKCYTKIGMFLECSFHPQFVLSNKALGMRDCILELKQFENIYITLFVLLLCILWTFFTLRMFVELSYFYYPISLNVIWMYYCKQFIKNKDAFYKLSTFVCLHSV